MIKRWIGVLCFLLLLGAAAAPSVFAEDEAVQIEKAEIVHPSGGVQMEGRHFWTEDEAEDGTMYADYDEEAFFAYLESACMERQEEISVKSYGISKDDIGEIYFRFAMTHPKALLRTKYAVSYTMSGVTVSLYPTYLLDSREEDDAARRLLQQKADEYANAAKQYASLTEQVLSVHDAIVRDTAYDNSFQETSYHAYGAANGGKAVCQGYSQMFYMVMDRMGIETNFITYTAGDPESPEDPAHANNHMWNCLKLNGKWYFLDVTWDDPDWENPSDAAHDYFLVSEDTMMQRDTAGGHGSKAKWSSYLSDGSIPDCTDTTYETGYIFNYPNPMSLVREDGMIGFYRSNQFYCSDSLYVGDMITSRVEDMRVRYFYLNTPPKEVTIYMVGRNRRGVVTGISTMKSQPVKNSIYSLYLAESFKRFPVLNLYFWEKGTLNMCGNRISVW